MTERFEISSVDEAEVLRYLGYRGAAEAPEVRALLDWGCAHASEVGRPAATVRTFGVAGREPRADGTPQIQLEGSALALDGADIASHLDGAVSVAVVAVTVGMGVVARACAGSPRRTWRGSSCSTPPRRPSWSVPLTWPRQASWGGLARRDASARRASRRGTGTCLWRASRSCSPPSMPSERSASR